MCTPSRHSRRALVLILALALVAAEAGAIELQQVTFATDLEYTGYASPAWSPDGSRLALNWWVIDQFHPYELHTYVAIALGSDWVEFPNQIPGTWHGPLNAHPSWSADGQRIVFVSGQRGGQLWVGTIGEPAPVSLGLYGDRPAWSPDGTTIAYEGATGIWLASSSGGGAHPLTSGQDPAWSHDGSSIAFISQGHVWVVPASGGTPQQITDGDATDAHPTWSPDGQLIAFESNRGGNSDLWVVRVANGALSRVTNDPANDSEPAWSPDGLRIAFTSDRSGAGNIWIASDLRTIRVDPVTWTDVKQAYR